MEKTPMMWVRYIGDKVCWTLPDERFYMGSCDELSPEERTVCNNGGGEMPVSDAIAIVAR